MNEREQRIRWLRGQIQSMLMRGDDVECLPLAEELERLESVCEADVIAAWTVQTLVRDALEE